MLDDALGQARAGVDVVVGIVETHGRVETEARLRPLPMLPRKEVAHRGHTLLEMDIDAILERRPALVLVDELAHANAPGSRHDKRWQDVEEILAAGIDVWSTLNIQHLESLNDVVASFTHVRVRETVPDRLLDRAEIEVVDTPPDELIERLRAGKVYVPHEARARCTTSFALQPFGAARTRAAPCRAGGRCADARCRAGAGACRHLGNGRSRAGGGGQPRCRQRRGARRAAPGRCLRAPWTAVHIETPGERGAQANARLAEAMHLATQLGGQVLALPAAGVVEGLAQAAADTRATLLVVGAPRPRRFAWQRRLTVDTLARRLPDLALQQVPVAHGAAPRVALAQPLLGMATWGATLRGLVPALAATALVTALGRLLFAAAPITNVALLYFLPVMLAATRYGLATGVITGLAASLAYNFFFIPPTGTFTIADPQNIITVLVLVAVAAVSSQLAARLRQQALLAGASARTSAALAGFARLLTGVTTAEELGRVLCAEAARLLDAHAVLLLPDGGKMAVAAAYPPENRLEVLDLAAAQWAFDRAQPAGRGSGTLTASEWLFTRWQPVARRWPCSAWRGETPRRRCAATACRCSAAWPTRPVWRWSASAWSMTWRACASWKSATGCAPRCSPRSATICAHRSPPWSAPCAN
jgi:two-component system sensor histidine kinase KdpD